MKYVLHYEDSEEEVHTYFNTSRERLDYIKFRNSDFERFEVLDSFNVSESEIKTLVGTLESVKSLLELSGHTFSTTTWGKFKPQCENFNLPTLYRSSETVFKSKDKSIALVGNLLFKKLPKGSDYKWILEAIIIPEASKDSNLYYLVSLQGGVAIRRFSLELTDYLVGPSKFEALQELQLKLNK